MNQKQWVYSPNKQHTEVGKQLRQAPQKMNKKGGAHTYTHQHEDVATEEVAACELHALRRNSIDRRLGSSLDWVVSKNNEEKETKLLAAAADDAKQTKNGGVAQKYKSTYST